MIDIRDGVHDLRRLHRFVGSVLRFAMCAGQVDVVFLDHRRHISRDHRIRVSDVFDAAGVQPHRAVSQRLHFGDGVRHEENGHAGVAHLVHFAHAALPEIDIAHRERFIHQQDLGLHMDGDGKGQAHAPCRSSKSSPADR